MRFKKYITVILVSVLFFSCTEEKLDLYSEGSYIQFGPEWSNLYEDRVGTSSVAFTFFYESDDVLQKDVTFPIYALGNVKDYDRSFVIEQVFVETDTLEGDEAVEVTEIHHAEAGVNYVAFDSEEMKNEYVIKAGESYFELPVRILRPADEDNIYTLRFKVVSNEHFDLGESVCRQRTLTFSSDITRPVWWNETRPLRYLKKYSKMKHKWLIQVTGLNWNDSTWDQVFGGDNMSYFEYIMKKINKELNVLNIEREANGLGDFTDEDGDIIDFYKF